jgi:copper transport protein
MLALLVVPAVASAHAELASSSPAANASLKEAPATLTLTFTEPVDPKSASIQLLDQNQQPIQGVGTVTVDAKATTAEASLPKLEPGIYTVSWRVTSSTDGHVTAGIFAFLIDPTGSVPAPTTSESSSSPSASGSTIAARWFALLAALALFGIAAFWLASARAVTPIATPSLAVAPWAGLAAVAALAFAGLAIYLSLAAAPFADVAGGGAAAGGGVPLDFAAPFGSTSFAWAMRLALAATGLAFIASAGRFFFADEARRRGAEIPRGERPLLLTVALLAAAALAGSSLAGHAASLGGPLFGLFDWLHLLAVGIWLGTLPGLLLLARRLGGMESRRAVLAAALRRHSRLALVAAPIVAITGIANSPIVLGSSRELVASDYGNLVLAKALLFSVAVAIGSANYFLVRRRAVGRILLLVSAELVVAALAVVAAAGMVTIQPAASRQPVLSSSSVDSLHLYGQVMDSTVHIAVSAPTPGPQTYQASVGDAITGEYRTDVQKLYLVFHPPAESNLPDERIELKQQADERLWQATGAYTPVVGDWKLEVVVRRVGQFDHSTTFDLPIIKPLPPRRVPPPDTGIAVPAPLAALWLVLPGGALGWGVTALFLLVFLAISLVQRARAGSRSRALAVARVAVVVLAVIAGLGVGSRAALSAANAPSESAANPVPADTDSIARGRNLYMANCSSCHGRDGSGNGPAAGGLLPPPGALASEVSTASEGDLAYVITNGVAGTGMPGFAATLSENDRWDLVNYLRSLYAPGDHAARR